MKEMGANRRTVAEQVNGDILEIAWIVALEGQIGRR
jgi:hypothetical protein